MLDGVGADTVFVDYTHLTTTIDDTGSTEKVISVQVRDATDQSNIVIFEVRTPAP